VRIDSSYFRIAFLQCLLAVVSATAFSQERCGTVEYNDKLLTNKLKVESNQQFEKWLQQKITARARTQSTQRDQTITYTVPVVVHVIHNGEALGTGRNIPDAQILSQIDVLNKDYQRLNADASQTPSEFLPVAASFNVQFVLAKQNPEGLATTGINRVKGTKTSWSINDNYELKALSYWPAEDYLNIWVCDLTSLLGYSQFPVSNLDGLENSSTNRLTDGVVIAYDAFGSNDYGSFNLLTNFAKGRSATHEIGHFFGLRHIWGDDGTDCSGTDYVDDTPNQAGSTSGCPTQPHITCGVDAMFQNYMDYTNDACMNLFTKDQVARMTNVIENSPRRVSLLTSHGLNNPAPVLNDLGIRTVVAPLSGECSTPVLPTIEIRNYGSNNISSVRIQLSRNGSVVETKDFTFAPALAPLQTTTVSFSSLVFPVGSSLVTFDVLQTNGTTDGQSNNNHGEQVVEVPYSIVLPFLEQFNTVPSTWKIENPDQKVTWALATTPTNGANKAMAMDFFDYEDNLGEIDALITPTFTLVNAPAALLRFDVAYARFQSSNDGLKVVVLTNCSADITQGTVVYNKSGATLATTTSTGAAFVPNADQWRTEQIDLSSYVGQQNLQIAFVGVNDWGNNLYIDNVSLSTTPLHDATLVRVVSPSPVTCLSGTVPVLQVKSSGTPITSLTVTTTVNDKAYTQVLTGLSIEGGTTKNITLNSVALADGENTVHFELSEPNGQPDFNPADNALDIKTVVNKSSDFIPLRQNFEGTFTPQWTIVNPGDGMIWRPIDLTGNKALVFNAFDNTVANDQAWLVSPVLDFSDAMEASVSFDVSYSANSNKNDVLRILASRDCGNSYKDTLYVANSVALANGKATASSWRPTTTSDWLSQNSTLTALAGEPEVRIAFVVTNGNGNNLYLDNIEFFVTETHIKATEPFTVYPNPASGGNANITFNIAQKGPVELEVVDSMGKTLLSQTLQDVLNQTYPLSLSSVATGVYLVRMRAGSETHLKKLIVIR
jgi:hypothetical protein